jgi:DNA repair exonuclease SbcCD ATPase subunit
LIIEKLEDKKADIWQSESTLSEKISKCDLGVCKLKASKSTNEKTVSKHSEVLEKLCVDCKNVFSEYYNLDKCLAEIKTATEKISKLESTKKKLLEDKNELSKSRFESEEKIQKARLKLRDLNAEAAESKAILARLESRIESLKSDLKKTTSAENPWLEMLTETKKKIGTGTKELETIALKRKHLDLAQNIVSQDTLRKFVIKDLVVLLNNKIKTYLTKLGANFHVIFDEDMDFEFVTPSGKCEWGNFSAGERMKTMVATSFAFRDFMSARNGLNANILILDEYFDSAIDAMTVESVLGLLNDMSNTLNQNMFVITHRKEVSSDLFDQILVVEKTNGISHASFI